MTERPAVPEVGSHWLHTSGRKYAVLHIANEPNDERYPLTVVYGDDDGKVWTRRADDWFRSMTLIVPPRTKELPK